MKKTLAGVGVAVVALGVLSYPGFGYLVERQLRHQISVMPKQYGMSVELKDFHRHWFSSEAVLHWEWHVPAHLTQNLQGQTITISPKHYEQDFKVRIFHGPIVFQRAQPFLGIGYADTSFDWPLSQKNDSSMFAKDSVFPKVHLNFSVDFLLQSSWTTEIPAFKLISAENKDQLQWQGMTLKNKITGHLDKVSGRIRFNGLEINHQDEQFKLKDFRSDYAFKMDKLGLYVGQLGLELDAAELNKNTVQLWKLAQFKMQNNTEIENQLFSAKFDASLASLSIMNQKSGPFELDLKLAQLNPSALKTMYASLQQQQNASPSFRNRGLWSITSSVPDLLRNGLKLELNKFHMVLEKGSIDAKLDLSVPADAGSMMLNLQRLQNLVGHAEIKVSKDILKEWLSSMLLSQMSAQTLSLDAPPVDTSQMLVEANTRIDQKLDSLVKTGVMHEDTGNYQIQFKLENGQLSVNNLPFDPTWLII